MHTRYNSVTIFPKSVLPTASVNIVAAAGKVSTPQRKENAQPIQRHLPVLINDRNNEQNAFALLLSYYFRIVVRSALPHTYISESIMMERHVSLLLGGCS